MDAHTYLQNFALRNCLVEVNESGELVPELAESWDVSKDARKWTFKIRSGIEFHNGKTLDADDVVASINSHRGENSTSAVKLLANQITSIKGNGNVVEIELESGNADYVYLLSSPEFVILPAGDGTPDYVSDQGTGAYVLENFEPGVNTVLKRNPNYWKSGAGNFESAEILAVNDGTALISGLNSRDLDVVNRVDPGLANKLSGLDHVDVVEYAGTLHYAFQMNTKSAPFDNNDVRLALKHGVDRESILSLVLSGHGSVGNDQPIGPANRYYNGDIPQRSFDPDKAAFHLKKAGLSSLDVSLFTSSGAFEGAVDAAVLLSEAEKKPESTWSSSDTRLTDTGAMYGSKNHGSQHGGVVGQRKIGCLLSVTPKAPRGMTPTSPTTVLTSY
jgi:peptide/nickel transport system substrate-binding protein